MPVDYYTCSSCGGLLRHQYSSFGENWREPEVVWLIAPPQPCTHPWSDESGLYFDPVPVELATAMITEGDRPALQLHKVKAPSEPR